MARILIVDDNADGRFAVSEVVRRNTEHDVAEAASGLEALEAVRSSGFDLVLLDVQMPDMDGFEVCRRLKSDEATRSVPVVFLTAIHQRLESRVQGLDVGADDYIVQPVHNLELLARIRAMLRIKAMDDALRRQNAELERRVEERTRDVAGLAEALRTERDVLREIFDASDEGFVLFEAAGTVLLENPAGRALEALGEVGQRVRALAREAMAAGVGSEQAFAASGREVVVRARPAGRERALVALHDRTQDREKELRLLQTEKLASIGLIAAGIGHEINNPAAFILANLASLAEMLQLVEAHLHGAAKPPLDVSGVLGEMQVIIDESATGMRRIHEIARGLRDIARMDETTDGGADLNAAVGSALTLLRNEIRCRTRVNKDLRATRPVGTTVGRLGQVFVNLIGNALQAMGGDDLARNELRLTTFDEGDAVIAEVVDNGPGFPPLVLSRLFEPFFTTKPVGVGTGLGLLISQRIVRAAGGEISADNAPGGGARFRIRLPSMKAVAKPAARTDAPRERSSTERLRLLAIDDEPLLLKAYRRILRGRHDVEIAGSGREALVLLERDQRFNLLLCDLQMPELSGMELYEQVRARWPSLTTRFVFVTGGATSAQAREFLAQSARATIEKPFTTEALEQVVARASAG